MIMTIYIVKTNFVITRARVAEERTIPTLSRGVFVKVQDTKTNVCVFPTNAATMTRQSLKLNIPEGKTKVEFYESSQVTLCPDNQDILVEIDFDFKTEAIADLEALIKK